MLQRQAEHKPCEQGTGDQSKKEVAAVEENREPQGNTAGEGNREYGDDIQYDGPHGWQKAAEEELSPAGESGIPLIAKVMCTDNDQKKQGKKLREQRPADRKPWNSLLL